MSKEIGFGHRDGDFIGLDLLKSTDMRPVQSDARYQLGDNDVLIYLSKNDVNYESAPFGEIIYLGGTGARVHFVKVIYRRIQSPPEKEPPPVRTIQLKYNYGIDRYQWHDGLAALGPRFNSREDAELWMSNRLGTETMEITLDVPLGGH